MKTLGNEHVLSIGLVTTGLSNAGGMYRVSKEMVKQFVLRKDVKDVTVVVRADLPSDPIEGAVLHPALGPVNYSLLTQWRVFIACMRYLRHCDFIHCLIEPYGPGAALAALILRKPFFISVIGTYSKPPKGSSPHDTIKRLLMRFMYRRAEMLLTMAEHNIRVINEVMTVNNWTFMPNGADLAGFPMPASYAPPAEPFILTVGALKPRKGQDTTVKALALLKDRFPTLRYLIVGRADGFSSFVGRIKAVAEEGGVADRVVFTGRIDDEELIRLYQTCSAFVLAAREVDGSFEGFPTVFYEAHGCGAPVISTYGFSSEYAIKEGYNGFLVQPDDPAALADAIANIVADGALRVQLGKNGRKEAELHSWDHIAAKHIEVYQRGVQKARGSLTQN